MASDSFPQEADARTKPDPEDGSSPSTEPALPTVATSAIALEPPTPEAFAPSSVALGPTVVRPRLEEAIRVEIVTAPKTSEERAWGLGFFALVTLVFTLATLAALSWNWSYVVRLPGLPAAIQSWAWPPFPFPALPSAILATVQMVVLGAVAYRFLFPRHTEPWEAIAFVLGLGEGLTALTGTILSLTWHFTFGWIEVVLLGEIMAFVLFSLVLRIPGRPSLSRWVAVVRGLRPHPRPFEWLALAGIASIAALVFYQATTERIIETDSLIYHAPLAALVYYHGGLPWIVGGGVGLSSSANYPQAFSLLGAYYYAWTGGVNDVYLRLIGAANWSLAIYATFLIGRRLAGGPPSRTDHAPAHPARCGRGGVRPVRAQLDPPRRPVVPVLPRAVLEPLPLPDDDGLRRDGVAECRPRPRVVRTIHRLVLGLPLPVRDEPVLRAPEPRLRRAGVPDPPRGEDPSKSRAGLLLLRRARRHLGGSGPVHPVRLARNPVLRDRSGRRRVRRPPSLPGLGLRGRPRSPRANRDRSRRQTPGRRPREPLHPPDRRRLRRQRVLLRGEHQPRRLLPVLWKALD